jgi:FkbM family methyltransferase
MRKILTRTNSTPFLQIIDTRLASYMCQKAPSLQKKRDYPFAVFVNDYIGVMINLFGLYEREELILLFALIEHLDEDAFSGTALDVGANIGNHTCAFASQFTSVFGFEPNPLVFQLLSFNTQFFPNVSVVNTALGDKPGKGQMKINDTNLGGSSISDHGNTEVVISTVDQLAAELNFKGVSLIKIDVEGFEARVLEGAQETIRLHQPIICFEQLESDFQNRTTEVIDFLKKQNYQFCWVEIGRRFVSNGWKRRFLTACDFFIGSRNTVVAGNRPPQRYHSMIIAVPNRLHSKL